MISTTARGVSYLTRIVGGGGEGRGANESPLEAVAKLAIKGSLNDSPRRAPFILPNRTGFFRVHRTPVFASYFYRFELH